MNKIVLENTRDVPLTTDLLAFMQASYSALEKLAGIGGDNFIISGCTVSGSTVTSGWMVLKGKLVPFTGGSIQTNVRIITTENVYPVGAGSETEIVYTAEFGTSANPDDNVAWADIKRPDTSAYLSDQMKTLLDTTIPNINGRLNTLEDEVDNLLVDITEIIYGSDSPRLDTGSTFIFHKCGKLVTANARLRFTGTTGELFDLPTNIPAPKEDIFYFTGIGVYLNTYNLYFHIENRKVYLDVQPDTGYTYYINFSYLIGT